MENFLFFVQWLFLYISIVISLVEAYTGPLEISKMEHYTTIVATLYILDVCGSSGYTSDF